MATLLARSDTKQNYAKLPPVPGGRTMGVTEAARELSVTPQTIRNWIRAERLEGKKVGRAWVVSAAAVQREAQRAPRRERSGSTERQLAALVAAVERLEARSTTSEELLELTRRERDHFRADAATAREAALRVNAAAGEINAAVRHLLSILELQSDALTQLLAPATPGDLRAS